MNRLHPAKNTGQLLEDYYISKIRKMLLVFFAGNLLIFLMLLASYADRQIGEGGYILRPEPATGEKSVEATAYLRDEEILRRPVTITVSEKAYSVEETEHFLDALCGDLDTLILGGNESLDQIKEPLVLTETYGESPVRVSWMSSDHGLIDPDGSVYNEELVQPVSVMLTAELACGDLKRETEIPVVLCPPVYTEEEELWKSLERQLCESDEMSREEDRAWLPTQVEGHEVYFVEKKAQSAQLVGLLLILGMFLLHRQQDQKLELALRDKEQELLAQYPEFVSKLTLLINAGMTVRGAIGRILDRYQSDRRQSDPGNACFEELSITLHEMESGIYEEKAYENLGKRIRLPPYVKLGGLLARNVKRGSKDLLKLLEEEAQEAFERRKNQARKLGEEAETKLLLPMMFMLLIVMALIVLPAFLSYQI
ncbi:MAG: type II secretion system F family protein [Lachnospiraceae bacterium]|nr:type II secretion system F family protein [Lachnospiraceae bacterium]